MDDLEDLNIPILHAQPGVDHDDLALALLVLFGHLHHTWADGRHLRGVLTADNGRHNIAAKGGTGHLEVAVRGVERVDALRLERERGRGAQILLILLHVHIEARAVRGQSGMDAASNTRRHVATDGARAEENDVRIEVLDDVLNSLDIRLRRVILQHGVVNDQHLARTILDQRLRLVAIL